MYRGLRDLGLKSLMKVARLVRLDLLTSHLLAAFSSIDEVSQIDKEQELVTFLSHRCHTDSPHPS
jgi:hypothetical protein